jgi:hypothetical protein
VRQKGIGARLTAPRQHERQRQQNDFSVSPQPCHLSILSPEAAGCAPCGPFLPDHGASCKIPLRLQNVSGHDRGTGEPGHRGTGAPGYRGTGVPSGSGSGSGSGRVPHR